MDKRTEVTMNKGMQVHNFLHLLRFNLIFYLKCNTKISLTNQPFITAVQHNWLTHDTDLEKTISN